MKTVFAWLGIFAALGIVTAGVVKNGTPAARSVKKALANRRAEMAAKKQLNGLIYVAGDGFSLHADSGASYRDILAHRDQAKYFTLVVANGGRTDLAFGKDARGFWISAGCAYQHDYFTHVDRDPAKIGNARFVLSSDEIKITAREDERGRTEISMKYADDSRYNPPDCVWGDLGDNEHRITTALDMIERIQRQK